MTCLFLSLALISQSDPPDLAPGDRVTITVGQSTRRWMRRHHGPAVPLFVAATETLDAFKELDAHFGRRPHPTAGGRPTLPSGAATVDVPDRTAATVLEVRPPDGAKNDTEAVRVRVVAGPLRGRELWVRRRMVVLRSRAAVSPRTAPPPSHRSP